MKRLDRLILVNFFLYGREEFKISGHTVFVGPNGTGKTAIVDALQVVMLGANGNYMQLNAQSDIERGLEGGSRRRTLKEYCLGAINDGFVRSSAHTYVTIVIKDDETGAESSAGVALTARAEDPGHNVEGMFVAHGIGLCLNDHLEETVGGSMPVAWEDFNRQLKRKAQELGKEAVIETRPEKYINDLLLAIGAGDRISKVDYLKAFSKSIKLRSIPSVDGFVRQFLIEARPINKQVAIRNIQHFKDLVRLVEECAQKITDLSVLDEKFGKARAALRRAAAYEAAAIAIEFEDVQDRLAAKQDDTEALKAELETEGSRFKELDARLETLDAEIKQIEAAMNAEGGGDAIKQAHEARTRISADITRYADDAWGVGLQLEGALNAAKQDAALAKHANAVHEGLKVLASARKALDDRDPEPASRALVSAVHAVSDMRETIEEFVEKGRQAHEASVNNLAEKRAAVQVLEKGGIDLGPDSNRLLLALAAKGITATPVCTKLRVTDERWQGAIEAFMSGNRDSLMVPRGRENESVDIMFAQHPPLYRTMIVQPDHLTEEMSRRPESDQVASLIEGDDQVAVAYARALFKGMRKVSTSDELRRNKRALAADGRLSSGGGTKVMRCELPRDFKFGRKFDPAQLKAARDEEARASAAEVADKQVLVDRIRIRDRIVRAADTQAMVGQINRAIDGLATSLETLARQDQLLKSLQSGKLGVLGAKLKDAHGLRTNAQKTRDDEIKKGGARVEKLRNLDEQISELKAKAANLSAKATEQRQDPDYDGQQEADRRADLEASGSSITSIIETARDRARRARTEGGNYRDDAMFELNRFITVHQYNVDEERRIPARAMIFVESELEKLRNTTLVQRRQEAQEAKDTAEQAFRRDVAILISSAIGDMERSMRELNRTLDLSDPFTHGEKYRFVAPVRKEHKALYDYICAAASSDDSSLFASDNQISERILQMLSDSAADPDGKAPTPLDDFRQLYDFDVEILVDGKRQSLLSRRMGGKGSGGEHKAPFYVIAGAALAHAYRLDAKGSMAAGIMILDEAFDKVDLTNCQAAAAFLDKLGLQLIMTAPDESTGKLMPIVDTIYEMSRGGDRVFTTVIQVKKEAQKLMISDMPHRNPGLLDAEVERVKARATA